MAALLCKAIFLPCQYAAKCLGEACQCCGELMQPLVDCFCNPEYPFSACFFLTFLGTFVPGVLTIGIVLSNFSLVSQACATSGLHTVTLVHVPIFVGHFLFAWYLNNQFVEVDRGRKVISKFWSMFLYDPAVLVYILFLVFNIVWLVMTSSAIAAAETEGCCDQVPSLCQMATACVALEGAFFVIGPCMVGFSLMNECCKADEQQREEARQRQAQMYARRGGGGSNAPIPLSTRLLASLPIIGCFFRPTQQPQAYAQPARGGQPPQAQVVQARPAGSTMERPGQAQYTPPQPAVAQAYAYPASGGGGSGADSAPPPAYSAQPQPYQPAQGGGAGPSAPPAPQQQEESTSALMGKLAGKAAKGIASGVTAGASAVSSARNKGPTPAQR